MVNKGLSLYAYQKLLYIIFGRQANLTDVRLISYVIMISYGQFHMAPDHLYVSFEKVDI